VSGYEPGGRDEAYRRLYDANVRAILGYALRRTTSPEDAADVTAETMLVAWRRLQEMPAGDEARLWLYGVARRVLANHRRGAERRDRLGARLKEQLVAVSPDPTDQVADRLGVRAAMERLSGADRELLQLTAWEGLEPREAALVLGVPARTVRTRLSRARARLRDELGDVFVSTGHAPEDTALFTTREGR
jgi:RNA polymerase sigma-70 factor (ECF subfamily)